MGKLKTIKLVGTLMVLITLTMNYGYSQPTGEPYSTDNSSGANLPVSPVRYTGNMKAPFNTHSWYSNLYFDGNNWSDGDYPNMISLIADPMCVHVDKGSGGPSLTAMNLRFVYNAGPANPHFRHVHEASDALIVTTLSGTAGEPKVDAYSDWGIKISQDNGALVTYTSNGNPFVNFTSNNGIMVKTKLPSTVWYNEGNVIAVEVTIRFYDDWGSQWVDWKDSYALYAPTGSTWSYTTDSEGKITLTSDLAGKDYFSVANIPDNIDINKKIADIKYLNKFAYNIITDTKVDWVYDEQNALVKTTFTATFEQKEDAGNKLLYALYPHQWLNYKGSLAPHDIKFNSARGDMKLIEAEGGVFETELKYYGVLPAFPLVATEESGYSDEELIAKVDEVIAAGEGNNVFQGNTVYATGVTLGRTAQVIDIADQVGLTEQRDTLLAWVRRNLEDWLTYEDGDKVYFYYDSNYGALIGIPPESGMFSDAHLNDAHFQMGYMIKAAAILAKYNPQWAKDWGGRVENLIKYTNNWKRDDPMFPPLRFMSPYQGFSWATGDADFRDGNNQESSSEALNYASAVALWGMQTGNKEIRDLGIYIYTTESDATLNYWWDYNEITYPKGKDFGNKEHAIFGYEADYLYPMSGFVFGDKSDFSTWFGSEQTGYQEYPVGINLLPMTAASTYLARNPEYVKTKLIDWFINKYGSVNRWNELFWEYLALADPQRALGYYKTQPHGETEPSPPSETAPHYYHWIHNMAAMGPYRSDITANTPSYAVFGEGSDLTYVAYNPTASEIVVEFSNGTVIAVPAGELVAETQSIDGYACIKSPANEEIIIDEDKNGSENVMLDASCSSHPTGSITNYSWKVDGENAASGMTANVTLANGTHSIELSITTSEGKVKTRTIEVFVTAGEPVAKAGEDQIVTDVDGNGSETVTLDGSGSFDAVGEITSWVWTEANNTIATGEVAEAVLTVGAHTITLAVTDNDGNVVTDDVVIHVVPEIGQDATIWASSEVEDPYNVVDNDVATSWVSQESDNPQWLAMDFGSEVKFDQVDITWHSSYFATAYEVQVSNDRDFTTVQTIASETGAKGGEVSYNSELTGRYMRVYGTESNGTTSDFVDGSGNFKAVVTSQGGSAPTITFEPLVEGIAKGFCYLKIIVNGTDKGSYPTTPGQPYTVQGVKDGDVVTFNYNYTLPSGAGVFSDDFEFEVGAVGGGKVYAIAEINVYSGGSRTPGMKENFKASQSSYSLANTVNVYPNPASGKLYIGGIDENTSYSIYNISGVNVINSKGKVVDISNIDAGLYILITNSNQRVKFIKE